MIPFFLRHAGTIRIARIDNQLRAELARRAEYAMRFQIHPPSQGDCFTGRTLALLIGLIAAAAIYCLV